jgi:nitroreductase/NAD-dependent dihydropyrimidine dehydrogenase PreA subunit
VAQLASEEKSVPTISVDRDQCRKDGLCAAVCPSRFLTTGADGYPAEAEGPHCIDCGHCVAVCPHDALTHADFPAASFEPVATDLPTAAALDGLLKSRRSVRLYKSHPLPKATIEELLDLARRAPTASNSQTLHWIVVNDPAKVHALAAEIVEFFRLANPVSPMIEVWKKGYDWTLRGAPTVIVATSPAEYDWGPSDAAIALTYLELAAEARALGVCWAGYLTRIANLHAPLKKLLAVPEGRVVCGAVMLGESRVKYRSIPPRKPLSVQWM